MLNVVPFSFPAEPSATGETALPLLDAVFRVGSYYHHANATGGFQQSAVVHAHDQALSVCWPTTAMTDILSGALVRLTLSEWSHLDGDRSVELAGLVVEKQPDAETNLFRTVPPDWTIDRHVLERGARLWEALTTGHRALFNAIFWDTERFQRYLTFPLNVRSEESLRSSLVVYSLELAELAIQDVPDEGPIDRSLITFCSLLYAAGKIDAWMGPAHGDASAWEEAGRYLGHRLIAYSWIVLACERYVIPLSCSERLAIDNVLMSAEGVVMGEGFPESRCVEAKLLQGAHSICWMCEIHGRQ